VEKSKEVIHMWIRFSTCGKPKWAVENFIHKGCGKPVEKFWEFSTCGKVVEKPVENL